MQARYDLANAYFSRGEHEQAIEQCLQMIKKDKRWQEDAARKLLLKMFDSLGSSDPITKVTLIFVRFPHNCSLEWT